MTDAVHPVRSIMPGSIKPGCTGDFAHARDAAAVATDLRRLLAGDVEFDEVSRALYATDAGLNQITPMGVVAPKDTDDVLCLVGYASEHGLSLVPRGMGSGLAGGAVGAGIQVDFTRYMNRIIEVGPDASWVRVQPGVVMGALNKHLRAYGSFFAPDPSSENYCSLGGMISTNSSGSRTVAYGGTKDHVLAVEAALADGSLFQAEPLALGSAELAELSAGNNPAARTFAWLLPELEAQRDAVAAGMPRVVKNCSGYRVESLLADGMAHLQRLFVGAEGTLGLVTEATLNLVPLPARRGIAMAYFPSVFVSGEAVPGILALGPTAVEIMDSRFLTVVRRHDPQTDAMLPPQTDTALLIEFEGRDDAELEDKFATLTRHLAHSGVLQVIRPRDARETERLWTVRKSAVALALRLPGPRRALPFIEDVTVHPTEVPGYVDFLQRLFDREEIDAFMYGHVGDGNIHTRPLLDPKDPTDLRTMERLYEEVSEYVLGIKGTMSGEHGDGLLRTPHVRRMYGEGLYNLFARIKESFDPQLMLNPGKKVGPQDDTGSLRRSLRYGDTYGTVPQHSVLAFQPGEYEREIEKCHGCAQCKSLTTLTMCPVYKATQREHASPRAKANVLRHIISGSLDPDGTYGSRAFKTVVDYCIVCGMCAVECPSAVDIPRLILEAKSRYRSLHHGGPMDLLLSRIEAVSRVGSRIAPVANRMVASPRLRRLAQPVTGLDHRRPMPAFAPVASAAGPGSRDGIWTSGVPHRDATPLIAYFHDLYARYNEPNLARTVVKVLQAHGLQVVIPPQRASAVPEMLYGYAAAARRVATENIRELLPFMERGAVLVGSEPTAVFAFKVHYPDYLDDQECALIASRTSDLGEFLLRYRADHPAGSPQATAHHEETAPLRIGYHQPCHLKAQQIGSPALDLLREIPGVEVVDLAAGCCGMAGTFGMKTKTYELSLQIGRPLFTRVAEVAPDIIASECSTCRLQLAHATGLETVHPITLLAQAYLS
jgi:FAD/FMN-containing dehydrogenase/Fe-S oxidoreductase